MRSLILAGGGLKVGFQAGVLQVWLDEAGLAFDHADGASGGTFNLAMYCQGMSGARIADNWRNLDPLAMVDFNEAVLTKLASTPSLFTLDNLRRKVFPAWGLDFEKIRTGTRLGTFNVCNFSRKRLEVVTHDRLTEDLLVACVSLPIWFPPVRIDGETYIDSVFLSDANVEEAIRRGADEIWAIWTVSTRDAWNDGFVAQYFQIIETAADGRFFDVWRRIERSNAEIAAGRPGEFGRPIRQRLLQAEVPVHYLINLSKDRMNEAVNLGVEVAREWCREQGIPLKPGVPVAPPSAQPIALQFTETMKGQVTAGETDYRTGADAAGGSATDFTLTIRTEDLDSFIRLPQHEAGATGYVDLQALGGRRPVEHGTFNLFVFGDDPSRKKMLYRLFFRDAEGNPFTLSGFKDVNDSRGFDVWKDTTTLFTRIYQGHVTADREATATVWGSGILTLGELALLKQLTTFRVDAPTLKARFEALGRFGAFFLGSLWDVYAQRVLTYAPF
jgi:predicted acylesterase/phospholipase RssA